MPSVGILVAVSIASLLVPLVFVALLVPAAIRRGRDQPVGPTLTLGLTFTGALALGVLALAGSFSLLVLAPIVIAGGALVWSLWTSRRRRGAGVALLGLGLPVLIATPFGATAPFGAPGLGADGLGSGIGSAVGLVLGIGGSACAVAGLILVARGDPTPLAPDPSAAPGRPGSRRLGSVARAILEPASAGPFALPVVASLVAYVAAWLVVPFLVPPSAPSLVASAIGVLVGAVAATEAYLRSFPGRSRRAFEAFSWYGEWELAAARATVGSIPRTRSEAEAWLATNPPREGDAGIRAEILVLAERYDEARATAGAMPTRTPVERWQRAATLDFVDWSAGAPGDPAAVQAAIESMEPGSDERLRAEVSLAIGEVRRRLADGRTDPGDALDPLLEVRDRLGRRADGQLGRALRTRLLVTYIVGGGLVAAVVASLSGGPLPRL